MIHERNVAKYSGLEYEFPDVLSRCVVNVVVDSPEVVRKCDELLQMLRSSLVNVPRRYRGVK